MFLSEEAIDKIVKFICKELDPTFIYLFGSFAKGEGRADSDIDLGVHIGKDVGAYDLYMLSNKLAIELDRDVQLINLKDISAVFAAQIVSTKEVLHCKDEVIMANYDIRALKEYVMLNRERKVILDAIEEDGRIYG